MGREAWQCLGSIVFVVRVLYLHHTVTTAASSVYCECILASAVWGLWGVHPLAQHLSVYARPVAVRFRMFSV